MSNKLNPDYFPTGPSGKTVLVSVLVILIIVLLCAWIYAPAFSATEYKTYLPLVTKHECSFRITDADCGHVFIEAINYPELSTDYYAGTFTVRKYPSLPIEFGTLHYWPEQSTDTIKRYWGAAQFELGVLYYLDAWVKCYGGQCWVENGDQLWMPCKPHKE